MNLRLLALLAVAALRPFAADAQTAAGVYNIVDFGAKGDSSHMNTDAINEAIRRCNAAGGGQVLVPPGKFMSGTIVLLSNVDLHLLPGASIEASGDTLDYLKNNNPLFSEGYTRYGLLYAFDAHNVSISGTGVIHGNGTHFMNGLDKPHMGHDFDRKYIRQGEEFMKPGTVFEDGPVSYSYRPGMMIQIQQCSNVQLLNVQLHDSPEWTVRLADCDNVLVHGVTVDNNPVIPNNDGIHCTNSRNVRISDCNIATGDDGIIVTGFADDSTGINAKTIYGNRTGKSENITVTNCVISSRSACVRVGYGQHPVRNLIFDNLVMYASNRGIGVFSRNKSSIENVLFSNITIETRLFSGHWWGKGEPIHVSAVKDSRDGDAGSIKNVRFVNVSASAETGIVVYGSAESVIQDLLFDNVTLTIGRGKYSDTYGGNFDLRPAYPVDHALFKHDIPGFFAQDVKGLSIQHFQLRWKQNLPAYFTNGLELDHVQQASVLYSDFAPAIAKTGLLPIKISRSTAVQVDRTSGAPGIAK